MIAIFKYEIGPGATEIELPEGAEVLSVAFQSHTLFMWAKVDTEVKTETRNFQVFGTGHKIPQDMGIDYKFIGTTHTNGGFVFHVFERLGL